MFSLIKKITSVIFPIEINILLQGGPYIEIKKDQTSSLSNSVKKVIKSLVILNNDTKTSVTFGSATFARFYALPKIHKINNLLRPIVSNFKKNYKWRLI